MPTRVRLWLASLLRQRRFDADLRDELAFHLRAREEYWEAQGLARSEARRRARVEFGSVDKVRAEVTDVRRGAWVEAFARDVRLGVRALRRHPAFSAMAMLSLAIGIGANAVIFGVAHAALFRSSPLQDPETLLNVYETESGSGFNPMSYPNIEDLRDGTAGVFRGIVASTFVAGPIERGGTTVTVMGEAITGGTFALLGIEPHLGRAIQAEDDIARGGHPVMMLGHGYWQRAFGADPQVVGSRLRMGRRTYTVIGIVPPEYGGGLPAITPAFYVPMVMLDELMGMNVLDRRNFHSFFVRARLAPGVSQAEAEHAASLVAASLTAARPEAWVPGEQFRFVPTADVQVYPGLDPLLNAAAWLLIAVVGLVLLLACTNLASFLLARALDRAHDGAVRRALGATRAALARQVLVESALLGLGGAAAGLVLAFVALHALLSADLPLPYGLTLAHLGLDRDILFDWRVLVLTAAGGIVAGCVLGFVPAVQGTCAAFGPGLQTGSRGSDAPGTLRWRNALVVAQIAMSLVLLVGAGLFLRSWQQMLAVDPGFGRAPTSILSVMVPVVTVDENVERTRRLLARFRAVPGVDAVGLVWPLPLEISSSSTDFTIDGQVPPAGREAFRASRATADGAFFTAMGMTIVEGRAFDDDHDRPTSQPVAIISEAMASRYWPDGALGRVLRRPDPAQPDLTIVGVASDINIRSLGESPRDVIYVPYTQGGGAPVRTFVARTAGDPDRLVQSLLMAGRDIDPDLQVMQATTMAQHLAMSRLPAQLGALLLSAFGALAMALASIGVYGLVRYTVARRTREVGIRMALGADADRVVRQLAASGVRLVLIGAAIGVAVSLAAARLVAPMLFGIGSVEPAAFLGAPLALGATAWLAAWLPARRASRVAPLAALRAE